MEQFKRHLYYSQTELQKLYKGKLSLKKIKELIAQHELMIIENYVTMGSASGKYNLTTKYVLKTDWHEKVITTLG